MERDKLTLSASSSEIPSTALDRERVEDGWKGREKGRGGLVKEGEVG